MTIKIKHKRGTASNITSANPTLAAGELAFETDTRRFKVGDGTTAWSSLSYVTPYVTATDRILGRSSAGAGSAEEITCTAFGRSLIDDADAAAARATLSVQPTASPAFTGTATVTIDSASSVTNPLLMLNPSMANNAIQLVRMGKASATNESMSLEYKYVSSGTSVLGFGHFGDAFGAGFCQAKGGNVGIGTSSPGGKLEVAGGQLLVTTGSASACGVAFSGDGDTGIAQLSAAGANTLSICTGGSERVRVDASGNVGIGVTPAASTTSSLQVVSDITLYGESRGFFGNLYFQSGFKYAGTGYGWGWVEGFGHVDFQRTSSSGTAGNTATLTTAIRITTDSEVLIGTTTDNGAYLLQVNSQIYATNATIATSDARFKTNVESVTDATAVIEALRPVAFDFIPHAERNFATERQVGLIAQEAQAALVGCDYADSVVAQCGDHLGLAYEKLVPVLIKALQESNARIAALEERLNHA